MERNLKPPTLWLEQAVKFGIVGLLILAVSINTLLVGYLFWKQYKLAEETPRVLASASQ